MKRIERSLKLFFMTELKLKEVENYSVFSTFDASEFESFRSYSTLEWL